VPWVLAFIFAAFAIAAGVQASQEGGRAVPGPGSTETSVPLRVDRTFRPAGTGGQPTGLAVSGDRLYVADPARGVVDVVTRDGSRVATIGAGTLEAPVYVAVGPVDGRIYVSDRVRNTVVVFSASGELFGVLTPRGIRAKSPVRASWRPLALGFAPDGTLYVADSTGDQSIAVFSAAGSRVATLGADVPAGRSGRRIAFPNGIAATSDRVVIADSNNGRLLVLGPDGTYVAAIGVKGLPRGVALLGNGRIVVTDAATNEVTLLTSAGVPAGRLSATGVGDGAFVSLAGVVADGDGRIYVSDSRTGAVHVVVSSSRGATGGVPDGGGKPPWVVLAIVAASIALGLAAFATARARAGTRKRTRTL